MPYITKDQKKDVAARGATSPGELNYSLTALIYKYIAQHGRLTYTVANDVLGALEGAKLEFYRRHIAPYEDIKIKENGDV